MRYADDASSVAIDDSQRVAAKVVGAAYLVAMGAAILADGVIGGRLIVPNNPTVTAQNILAHETLFRAGIGASVLVVMTDVALITALYLVLRKTGEGLALFATFLRLVESGLSAATVLDYLRALGLIGPNAPGQAFNSEQLRTLASLSIGSYNAELGIAFLYLGVGSAVFSYLWRRSHYIPRWLADLGIFASLLLFGGSLTFVVAPQVWSRIFPFYMAPLFFFEVGIGVWLLTKGLPRRAPAVIPPS